MGFFYLNQMYWVYILFSRKLDKYYIGSTNDLHRRLEDHNRGKTPFTKLGMPWELKYTENFETRKDVIRRELEIKRKKSRKYIESLIATSSAGSSIPPQAEGSLVPRPDDSVGRGTQ